MHTSTKLQYTPHQFAQCDEVSGLLWEGCRKQSNWIIILIVKYKVGIRIRVHSTIFKVLNQAVASLKLRQLWTVCDCFLCLNQLSKSSVNNYQQQWWCLDCLATVDTWLWRLSIRTSSCASGKIQCRLLILFYICLNVPSGNLCREAVLVLAGLC